METKHTPGPWEIKPSDRGVTIEAGDQFEVARCPGDAQGRIDACLIATAPELLEAAIAIAEILRGWPMPGMQREFNALCDAIAKATGSEA